MSSFPDDSEPDFPCVTQGQSLMLVIPKHKESDEDTPRVMTGRQEVMSFDQLMLLIDSERVYEESTSGEDLALNHVYKEFVVKSLQ